tara:strand:- start:300 stop:521 length:222 start_codon:yes stop_codon:yes gene_type:complete
VVVVVVEVVVVEVIVVVVEVVVVEVVVIVVEVGVRFSITSSEFPLNRRPSATTIPRKQTKRGSSQDLIFIPRA